MIINNRLADGSPRRGEVWVNGWGFFYSGFYGLETPRGRPFYLKSPVMRLRHSRLRREAERKMRQS